LGYFIYTDESTPMTDITQILNEIQDGQRQRAEELLPLVYTELRRLAAQKMARESPNHTLNPTALVHEAFIRMVGQKDMPRWESRLHFYCAAAQAMRRILIDRARKKLGKKYGGGRRKQSLSDVESKISSDDRNLIDLMALDEALTRLESADKQCADLVKLRYYAGLSMDDAAQALGISPRTADSWWAYSRAFLATAMGGGDNSVNG
jgi:RNA polymerase sigma factor (TIGR02999 family)